MCEYELSDDSILSKKMCFKCRDNLPLEQFYSNGFGRVDSWCKSCRKLQKKQKYLVKRIENQDLSSPIIFVDHKEDEQLLSTIVEKTNRDASVKKNEKIKESGAKSIDYSVWDRLYGRGLDSAERVEIKTSIQRLVEILIGYGQAGN